LSPKLFNPAALLRDTDFICVTEGEIDAISAEQAGMPTVGIPGATQWVGWYSRLFKGYKTVYFLQDDDKAGQEMAENWASEIANVKVIVMPSGDVNSTLVDLGEDQLRALILGDQALFFAFMLNKRDYRLIRREDA
jgi:DNA primase